MSSGLEGTVAALLEEHWEPTFRLAHAVLRDPGAAEDAAQLAFVKVVLVLREGRPIEQPGPFLRSVVMNEARQSLRGARRRSAHEERAAGERPEAALSSEPGRAVRELIEGLPETLRLPLELHYALGLTHAEVGELLECPRGTVTSRIQDGLEKLRGSLAIAGIVLAIAAIEALLAGPVHALEAPAAPSAKSLLRRASPKPAAKLASLAKVGLVTALAGAGGVLLATVLHAPDSLKQTANGGHPGGHDHGEHAAVAPSDSAGVAPIDTTGGLAPAAPGQRVAKDERRIERRVLSRGSAGTALHVPDGGGFVLTRDGTRLFAYAKEEMQVFELGTRRPLFKIRCAGPDAHHIWSAALSRDESRLFTWDRGRQLCVWDARTGALLEKHVHEKVDGLHLLVAPDGRSIAIGRGYRGTTTILTPDGATVLREVGPEVEVRGGHDFSPDGKLLALYSMYRIRLIDPDDGREVRAIDSGESGERFVAFSPDGSRIYGGVRDAIKVWATATGDLLHEIDAKNAIDCLEFSPDGATLLLGFHDGKIAVVATATGRIERTLVASRRNIVQLSFLPGGKKVLVSSLDDTYRILDLATGKTDTTPEGHSTTVSRAAVSQDGRRAATVSEDNSVAVWDIASGRLLRLVERAQPASVLAFAPDGRTLVVDGLPHLPYARRDEVEPFFARLDAVTGDAVATYGRPVSDGHWCGSSSVVTADVSRVALVSFGKSAIHCFELEGMRPVGAPVPVNVEHRVVLALTASGEGLAVASDAEPGRVRVHSVQTGELVREIATTSKRVVESLAFTREGRRLIVAEGDAKVRICSPATGDVIRTIENLSRPELSPRGDLLAGLSGDVLRVISLETGETFAETRVAGRLTALGFGPDGRTIVAGDAQGGVSVFELPAR